MIFYDFEVFRYDWLVVLIDLNAKKETVIINDPDKLKRFYEEHKGVIWAGYNSRNYDQYILKAILCGFDPKPVNDWIIAEAKPGYRYGDLSDILEGATRGKIRCGIGHGGGSYWTTRTYNGIDWGLGTEAFAEMTSATMTSPESLATIKKYLPKSYAMYEDMLKVIANQP